MLANPFASVCPSWDLQFYPWKQDKSRAPGIETICTFTFFRKDFTIITQMCLLPHLNIVPRSGRLTNTGPTSTCKNGLKRFICIYIYINYICSIQILHQKKLNLPIVNWVNLMDHAAKIAGSRNCFQPSTPKNSSPSVEWSAPNPFELKNPGQGCFSSLAVWFCIAALWQPSLNL